VFAFQQSAFSCQLHSGNMPHSTKGLISTIIDLEQYLILFCKVENYLFTIPEFLCAGKMLFHSFSGMIHA
jgi:hypothetical protein